MNRTLFSNSHLLENGDILGRDEAGRTVIQLPADDWLLEQLTTFDAGSEDLEDNGDGEPDDDAEPSESPCWSHRFHFSIW